MTAEIHTCSYECERPGCIRAQRDELAARLTAAMSQQHAPSAPVGVDGHYHPCTSILIEGLKRLDGGDAVLEEWDRARAKVDTDLAQQSEARVVVDEGSRIVTSQLLHWGGIPVRVTGTVTTSPGNWSLIDDPQHKEPKS